MSASRVVVLVSSGLEDLNKAVSCHLFLFLLRVWLCFYLVMEVVFPLVGTCFENCLFGFCLYRFLSNRCANDFLIWIDWICSLIVEVILKK